MIGKLKGRDVVASISNNYWFVGSESGWGIASLTRALQSSKPKSRSCTARNETEQIAILKNILG